LNKDIQQEKISTPNEEDYSKSQDQYASKENKNLEKSTHSQDQSGKGKNTNASLKTLRKIKVSILFLFIKRYFRIFSHQSWSRCDAG